MESILATFFKKATKNHPFYVQCLENPHFPAHITQRFAENRLQLVVDASEGAAHYARL
jgi:hypothetical protein